MAALQGKRMPFVDQVQIEITEEPRPRWLSFARGETGVIEYVPPEFTGIAMPGNKLAPNLAKRGIRMVGTTGPTSRSPTNMEDPVLGGYTPEKAALRRAINLAVDVDKGSAPAPPRPAMKAQRRRPADQLWLLAGLQDRDGRVQPAQGQGPARPLWLHRQRRRWLARPA